MGWQESMPSSASVQLGLLVDWLLWEVGAGACLSKLEERRSTLPDRSQCVNFTLSVVGIRFSYHRFRKFELNF